MSILRPRRLAVSMSGTPDRKVVVTMPVAAGTGFPAVGIAQKVGFQDTEIWLLLIEVDAPISVIARLVAVLLVDDAERVLHPMFMPDHPAVVLIHRDGQIRQGRGFFLAPWAENEIVRVASRLEAEHSPYLAEISHALNQTPCEFFKPLEPGFFVSVAIGSERMGPMPTGVNIDTSQCERTLHGLQWFQVAAQDYRRNRYLLQLSDEALGRRIEDIMANVHIIDDAGLVSFDASDPYMRYWMGLMNDIQTEMAIRHGPYPSGWKKGMIDHARMPGSLMRTTPGSPLILRPAKAASPPFLVKYGKRQYMEAMLFRGAIRISPASSYADPSLNNAVRDAELVAETNHDPFVPFNFAPPGTVLMPPGRVTTRLELPTNFYPYSLSEKLSVRLMLDFEAEACVLIHDSERFLSRLLEVAAFRLHGWTSRTAHVEYYDPLLVHPGEIAIAFWKHFRQAYQHEVRVGWFPLSPVSALPYLDLELGNLQDIAELVLPQP